MKKIYNIFTLLVIALMGLSLTACSEDDLDTNQFGGGVRLNAFGPSPVMRGGQLRFIGSNLDQIREVHIPGVSPITSIEVVKAGVPSEIRVTVPKDGPEEGFVTIVANDDREFTTVTKLTYTEPIIIESITPMAVMPGEEISIKGDYLNLIHMVEFEDEVRVSENDFTAHDRYEIKVKVPAEARTGKLNLYTADLVVADDPNNVSYNIMTSDEAVEIGTPTVSKASSPRGEAAQLGNVVIKQGETLTISGSYMKLVKAVKFGEVEVTELNVSEDGKSLTLALPAEAPDGDVVIVCQSDVEVPVCTIETVAPTNCVAAPAPVKAGAALTITGNDMDVVDAVEMPNVTDAIEIENDGTKVIVKAVPETAQEGNLVLRMKNGKGVEVPFTLVKPVVTGYDNATVSAGGALVIKGTDLDLVKSIKFGDSDEVTEFTAQSAEGITLTVPMNAVSGEPTLALANGTTVNGLSLNVQEAVFCYATELPGEDVELKAGSTVTLTVANGDKLTGVEVNGNTVQYVLTEGNKLIIGLPETCGAGTKIHLVSSNGDITYTLDVTPNTEVNTVIWTGAVDLAGWSINWQFGDGTQSAGEDPLAFTKIDLAEGDVIHIYATQYNETWQMQFFNGHWEGQTYIGDLFGNAGKNNVNSDIASLENGCLDIPVTAQLVSDLTTLTDWGYCWILQGEGVVITKISVTHYNILEQDIRTACYAESDKEFASPIKFPVPMSWSDADNGKVRININGDPNISSMKLKAGQSVMYFYTTGKGQIQVNDANWTGIKTLANWDVDGDMKMELPLTQDLINCLTGVTGDGWSSTGLILQGDGLSINKITLLP